MRLVDATEAEAIVSIRAPFSFSRLKGLPLVLPLSLDERLKKEVDGPVAPGPTGRGGGLEDEADAIEARFATGEGGGEAASRAASASVSLMTFD